MIYLDQAATSLIKPKAVAKAVYEAIASETLGNPSRGGHKASLTASRLIHHTRSTIEDFFNAGDYHVVLTKNVTEALNTAIKGLIGPNDHVITSVLEHNSVLRPLYQLEATGTTLDFVSCEKGTSNLILDDFSRLLKANTKAVVITHASNVTGSVTNMEWISHFCKENNLLLIVDGAQTAGILPINLDQLDMDVFCFTGHKSLYGPQGTGGMCVKKALNITPNTTGGSGNNTFSKHQPATMPEKLEAGTPNLPGLSGLVAGINYVQKIGIEVLSNHVNHLAITFLTEIKKMSFVDPFVTENLANTGIVPLKVTGLDASEVSEWLEENYDIYTRPGAHCAPLFHQHLNTESCGIVRFSFSAFNTKEQVMVAVNALQELGKELTKNA